MFTFIGVDLSCNDFNTEHCKAPTTRMFTINHFFTSKKVQPEVGVHYNNHYGLLSCTLRKSWPTLRSSIHSAGGSIRYLRCSKICFANRAAIFLSIRLISKYLHMRELHRRPILKSAILRHFLLITYWHTIRC